MMDRLFERLSDLPVAIPIAILVIYSGYRQLTAEPSVPTGVPWVGKEPNKVFADTRATFASFSNVRKWLGEGYEKVGWPTSRYNNKS